MSLPTKVCKGRTHVTRARISCFRTLPSKYSCKICHQQHDAKCLKGHAGLASQDYNDCIMVALTCSHVQTAAKEMTGYHLSGKTMPSCCLIWRLLCWHDADGTKSFITRLVNQVKKIQCYNSKSLPTAVTTRPEENGVHAAAQQKALQSTRQKMKANNILKALTASAVRLLTSSARIICSDNQIKSVL